MCWMNEKVPVVNKSKVNPTKITKGVFSVADEFKECICLSYTICCRTFLFYVAGDRKPAQAVEKKRSNGTKNDAVVMEKPILRIIYVYNFENWRLLSCWKSVSAINYVKGKLLLHLDVVTSEVGGSGKWVCPYWRAKLRALRSQTDRHGSVLHERHELITSRSPI